MVDKETMLNKHNEYIKYFDKCEEIKIKNNELQNKVVMTISTALFGIIITSLDKIIPLMSSIICLKYLFISLIIFNALVIVSIFASIHYANKGIDISIKNAETYYLNTGEMKEDKCSKLATKLRYLYIIFICIVITIFVIILTIILFSKDYKMDKNKSKELSLCMESLTAPKIPISFYDSKIQSQINYIRTDSNSNEITIQQEDNQTKDNNTKEDN
ncbi:hypothetical protein DYR41_08130 [Campylobacter jejuni]|uniref:hypothetical protein n=1 Tax=Campylobacter sp. CNRCH_2016_3089 TaxID=2911609 RepID=UPI0012821903|nr:hypothetical protein [Campylobacter sp. CNRCH_2016_3089]EAL8577321.1 hypothetical protein [Campylobacter jejuni]ECQ3442428.1 hypothetical protein [Campylobacter jejuni]EGC2808243.1 hypothetical protein [Campylobacter jejuni]EID8610906.1 hypothetical protein [Campylobacter jejuni]EJP8340864.1 hypothetical protein [Campylobacter jejuni]